MKGISAEAQGLLEQLHHSPQADRAYCLGRLAEFAEPACLSSLLPLALDSAWAQPLAACIRATLVNLDPDELPGWDARWRQCPRIGGERTHQWWQLQPRELLSLGRLPDGDWVLAAACSHHHGYLRELAVRRLAQSDRAVWKLGYLLVRCKDWVEPVRASARAAVSQRLAECSPEILVNHIVLLEWLGDSEFLSMIDPAWGLRHRRPAVRRLAYRLAFPDSSTREELLQQALGDEDSRLVSWAASQLSCPALDRDWLKSVFRHRCAVVRRRALEALVERRAHPEVLQTALLDVSLQVQEVAQLAASLDLRAFYLEALDHSPKAALQGLSLVGKAEEVGRASAFLHHPSTRVARAAIRCLAKLDAEGALDDFLAILAGPRSGPSREAAEWLAPRAGRLSGHLEALARNGAAPLYARRRALKLLEGGSKWGSVSTWVEMSAVEAFHGQCLQLLEGWLHRYNRRHIPPTLADKQRLSQALRSHPLPPTLHRQLESLVTDV